MKKVDEYIQFYKKHKRHPVMNNGKEERKLRQWLMQIVCYSRYEGYNAEKQYIEALKTAGITDVDNIALARQLTVLDELIEFWTINQRLPRQSSESGEDEQKLSRWRLNKIFKRSDELDAIIKERKVEFLFDKNSGTHAKNRTEQLSKHEQVKAERVPLFEKLEIAYDSNQVYYNQLVKLDQFIDFVKKSGRVPRCYDKDEAGKLYSWWKNKINARFTSNGESRAKWNPEFLTAMHNAGLPDLFRQAHEIPEKYAPRKPKD